MLCACGCALDITTEDGAAPALQSLEITLLMSGHHDVPFSPEDDADDGDAGVADDSDEDMLTVVLGSAAAAFIAAHCRRAFVAQ